MSVQMEEMQRVTAAMAIASKMSALAKLNGFSISRSEWNLGQGMNHRGPHRLDAQANGRAVRTYLTDHELAMYLRSQSTTVVESKLLKVVQRLNDSSS